MTTSTRRTPIEELCDALHSGGFVLAAESRTTLSLRPRAGVSDAMAAAIRRYRSKLIDFLVDRDPCAPFPCSDCCGEFVSTPSEPCPACRARRGKALTFASKEDESAFLRAYEARQRELQKNCPNSPNGLPTDELGQFVKNPPTL